MKQLKYSVIGTSWITESFIEGAALIKGLSLLGVYSRTQEKGRAFAEKTGATQVYTSLSELKNSGSDFVYVASPNICHFEQCKFLLENKINVICEKPITITAAEFSELFSIAEKNGVRYFEAIMYMHTPARNIVKNALFKLGNIYTASIDFSQLSSKYEKLVSGELPNIFNPAMKTGALNDLGIYCVYPVIDIFGEPERTVKIQSFLPTGADGSGAAILKYDKSLVTITYSKTGQSRGCSQLIGDNGTITVESISQLTNIFYTDKNGNRAELVGETEKKYLMANEAQSMVNFIIDFDKYREFYYECADMTKKVLSCMEKMREENHE